MAINYRSGRKRVEHLRRARRLRGDSTDAERALWALLRNRNLSGAKFRRQHEFGPYILDFYCPAQRLAVEAEGGQHHEPRGILEDLERTKYLESSGVRVLRFTNIEILHEAEGVAASIQRALEETPSRSPSPRGRGDSSSPPVRQAVERMAPYAPPEDPDLVAARAGVSPAAVIKLDANENPYGPSPAVRRALARFDSYHRYPDPDAKALRPLVAQYAGVRPEQVLLGNGSDELIDLLCRIYVEPGDEVVDCTPTFGMYRFSTELCGGHIVEAQRTDDWRVDVDAVRRAVTPRTKILFVASPNNPTGTRLDETAVGALLDAGPLVVLDEAYVEFSRGESYVSWVEQHPNLVVLRTFSKWAGLAGLRIGYGVFPLQILRHLWKVKPPFNVNLAAEVAVRATLEDLPRVRRAVRRIVRERDRMTRALASVSGLTVWPSDANFLLVQVQGGDAESLTEELARHAIAVRTYSHARLRNAVRISVALPEDTDAVVSALRQWEGPE